MNELFELMAETEEITDDQRHEIIAGNREVIEGVYERMSKKYDYWKGARKPSEVTESLVVRYENFMNALLEVL